jgi:VIT1/CCC1 family predicted Fe2+/Mn2+ transporter
MLPIEEMELMKFIIASIVTFGGLFLAGALKKFVTGKNWFKSGIEMLLVGAFAFGVSYLIGFAIDLIA